MPRSKIAGIALRRALGVDARRAAGKDQPFGRKLADARGRDVVPHDLAVHVLLANAAGDELGVLRAEIEHEHALGGEMPVRLLGCGGRECWSRPYRAHS